MSSRADQQASDEANEVIEDDEADGDEDAEERTKEGSKFYQRLKTIPSMSRGDQQRLLQAVHEHDPRHYPIFYLMARLCLPLVAVLGLKIGDINRRAKTLRIVRGWGEQGAFPIPNGAHSFHPHGDLGPLAFILDADVRQVVDDQVAALTAEGRPCGPEDWLFPGRGNQPWKFRYISNFTLLPALEHCGLPKLFPKDLYYCFLKTHIEEDCSHDESI